MLLSAYCSCAVLYSVHRELLLPAGGARDQHHDRHSLHMQRPTHSVLLHQVARMFERGDPPAGLWGLARLGFCVGRRGKGVRAGKDAYLTYYLFDVLFLMPLSSPLPWCLVVLTLQFIFPQGTQVGSYYTYGRCQGYPGNAVTTPTVQSTATGGIDKAPIYPFNPTMTGEYCYQVWKIPGMTGKSGRGCKGQGDWK